MVKSGKESVIMKKNIKIYRIFFSIGMSQAYEPEKTYYTSLQ